MTKDSKDKVAPTPDGLLIGNVLEAVIARHTRHAHGVDGVGDVEPAWADEVRAAFEADSKTGAALIAAERARQIEAEGYTAEHDDEHDAGSLALVAALYATPWKLYEHRMFATAMTFGDAWPWEPRFDRRPRVGNVILDNITLPRADRIRQLVKAGALLAAEIDRLQRLDDDKDDKDEVSR